MSAPTTASNDSVAKKIDSELRNSYERILQAVNTEINRYERMFNAALKKYELAMTEEATRKADEEGILQGEVCERLEEKRKVINSWLTTVMERQWQREAEERASYAELVEVKE